MDELAMLNAAHDLNDELVKYKNSYTQAIEHLQAVLAVEWRFDGGDCVWCGAWEKDGHYSDCDRQAAAKWLEENTNA